MDLLTMNISELSQLISSSRLTSEELTRTYIKHIEESNLDKKIFAIFNRDEAIERAKEIDRKRSNGNRLGILAGIPMALTDEISSKGILTSVGSKMLENYIPPFNASVLDSLLEEDAILLGKVKINEFGLASNGFLREAIEKKAIPYIVTSLLDEDGLYSIRPGYGSVSRYGLISSSSSFAQVGVIGRSIEDMAIVLNAIVAHDKRDSSSIDFPRDDFRLSLVENIEGLKIALPSEFLDDSLDKALVDQLRNIISGLENLGASFEEVFFKSTKYISPVYKILSSAEFVSNTARYDGISFGYRTSDYKDRDELYKKSRTEAFTRETKKAILFGNYVTRGENYINYYEKSQKIRTAIREEVNNRLKRNHAILIPLIRGEDIANSYRVLDSLVGLPSIILAYNDKISLKFLGPVFSEDRLLQIAYSYKKELGSLGAYEVIDNG